MHGRARSGEDTGGRPLETLPKAHLHLHLEGAMRRATLDELAERYDVVVPEPEGFGTFAAFAGTYAACCEVLRSLDDLARLTREIVEDAASAGCVHVEPSLWAVQHEDRLGIPQSEIVARVVDAGEEAATAAGIGFGLMIAANRDFGADAAVEAARLATGFADRGVVSFGLDNDEAAFPPGPFASAFEIAREAGLIAAPHAGELAGPESIRAALDDLGARRIMHGVRAAEDPELVERLAAEEICLDVCPTSNHLLGVFPDFTDSPLRQLIEGGVPCSINTDDPLLFGLDLLQEYERCRNQLGLDDSQLAASARASVLHSGASADLKRNAAKGIDSWLAAPPAGGGSAP